MRILIVGHSHQLGGIERHIVHQLTTLRAAGHAVCFAGPLDSWLGEQCRRHRLLTLHLPMRGMYDALSALRLAHFARRWQADLLHGHAQRGARYASWAGHWSDLPAVATAHATNAFHRFEWAQYIVCVSEAVRAALVGHGYPPQQLVRIYSGIPDPAPQAPRRAVARAALRIEDDQLVLGMIARFVAAKGHEVAIAALAALRRPDVVLLLAGADNGPRADAARQLAATLGVASQVRFLGEREDIPAILAACDLIVAPSHREALSLSLLEAAAMGIPAVASRVGGIPEAVHEGTTGLLFADGDHLAMASAIARLADDPEQRHRMGDAARVRFVDLFGTGSMLKALESLYDECVATHLVGAAVGAMP